VITLDTGALIALERRSARMLRVVAAAVHGDEPITVPTVVVAEWWRGRSSKRMLQLLASVALEPLNARLARIAGEALAAVRRATTVDAIVMASAAQRGGAVFTSDVYDLERLADYFPGVRVLHA
jgi:predicted nucleic acid-binding protein